MMSEVLREDPCSVRVRVGRRRQQRSFAFHQACRERMTTRTTMRRDSGFTIKNTTKRAGKQASEPYTRARQSRNRRKIACGPHSLRPSFSQCCNSSAPVCVGVCVRCKNSMLACGIGCTHRGKVHASVVAFCRWFSMAGNNFLISECGKKGGAMCNLAVGLI